MYLARLLKKSHTASTVASCASSEIGVVSDLVIVAQPADTHSANAAIKSIVFLVAPEAYAKGLRPLRRGRLGPLRGGFAGSRASGEGARPLPRGADRRPRTR